MAVFKCQECGFQKEGRCKLGKCPECQGQSIFERVE